jgi:hypothetical protein
VRKPAPPPKSVFVTARVKSGRVELYDAWLTREQAKDWCRHRALLAVGVGVKYVGEYVRRKEER